MKNNMEMQVRSYIAENYWLQKLASVTYNPLYGDKSNPGDDLLKTFGQFSISFPGGLSGALQEITGDSEAKKFLVFMTALHVLVYKYNGVTDILTGTTGFLDDEPGRKNPGVLLFSRVEVNGECVIRDLLNTALGDLNTAYENRHFDYEIFLKRFCQQNPGEEKALTALALVYDCFNKECRLTGECDLLFRIERTGGGFGLVITYVTPYYSREQAEQLGHHFVNVLISMVENPGKTVDQVIMLSGEDLRKLLVDFCGEIVEYKPEEKTFLPSFAAQVLKSPEATAVTCEDRMLNYRELDEITNRLARLMQTGGGLLLGDLAAILMERSENMMVSIIATWKCGAAYVPIDPDYPAERIKTIMKDSRAKLLITVKGTPHPELENTLKANIPIIKLDEMNEILAKQSKNNINIQIFPMSPAYVIYTSGSTGKPKGVMVEHRGMMNHLYAKIAEIQIDAQSIIVQNASQCFDISVWQFFAALLKGGCTTVYPQQLVLSPEIFIKRSGTDGITIMEVVPAYLDMMLNTIEERKLGHVFPRLKYLLVTGETVRPGLVKRWFEKFPGTKMVNAYGPTEASDDITHFIMDRFPGGKSIPIGKTLRNTRIYIVDARMNLCPLGIKGELLVSGAGVCRGYLNNPELTAAKFINPLLIKSFLGSRGDFSKKPLVAEGTLYRTGDIARYLPDGNIEFFGRKDFQVKIRGFRIELEEIENKLSTMPGIRSAVVLDKEDKAGNKYLCAYIILKDGIAKQQEEIKEELRNALPEYMIPANIVILQSLPLSPNGKVNRRALLEMGNADIRGTEYAPPRSEVEKKLAEILQEVLGIEKIGIHDNFFNLGGDSFKGIQVVNKIQEWIEEVVHVTVLFMAPTIAELAVKLESYKKPDLEIRLDASKFAEFRSIIRPPVPLPSSFIPPVKTPPVMFILSPFRSGSTLLRVILAGHPGLFAPQEFELLSFNTLAERKEALSGKFSLYLEGVIRAIMELKQIGADEAKAIMEEFEAGGMTVPEFYGELQNWLGKRMLVEKTPEYAYHIEILNRAESYFASPLYIHLIRHPYAVIHSYENARLDQLFKYEHRFSPRQLGELLWVICHQNILQFLENIPRNRQFQLKYEDLVSDPGSWIAKMCRHFELEFYPGMLDVYKDAGNRMTDGIYTQSKMLGDVKFFTHKSIDTQSVDLWKNKYKTDFLSNEACKLAGDFGYLEEKIEYSRIEAVPRKEHYVLAPAQKRLWLLSRLEENNIAYNIPQVIWVEGNLEVSALERAFETVLRRHEGLRTTFITVEEEPRQKIHDFDSMEFKLEYLELDRGNPAGNSEEQTKNLVLREIRTPFDLEKGPLMRIKLIRLADERYIFIFSMHHIISDGWSMRLLTDELLGLYEVNTNGGENRLPALQYQYKDYSEWLNRVSLEKELKRQSKYWLKKYEGEIPVLELPTDFARPIVQSFEGSSINFEINSETTGALKDLALETRATLYIVLLTLYTILLSKLSSQEDIVIGTPVAGRSHADLEKIIGMFVNTLAFRMYPSGEKRFMEFLGEVTETTLKGFENQDYQYEELVENAAVKRDSSRNPLFDTMFVLQNTSFQKIEIPGLKLAPYPYENKTAKFDLTLTAVEAEEKLLFNLEYCTKLFNEETANRFINYFKNVVNGIIENKERRISDFEIITKEEKRQIIFDFNNTEAEYPKDKIIHQLLAEQAAQTPDAIALVARETREKHEKQITYFELNEQSSGLAGLLIEKGVLPDTIVAIMMERSVELIVVILGILKSGGAYLPIDPEYPQERIDYMLKDSNAKVLIINKSEIRNPKLETNPNNQNLNDQNKNRNSGVALVLNFENLNLNSIKGCPRRGLSNFDIRASNLFSSNLAYVIYTSGSTGRPKGVMVNHRNVVRLVKCTNYIEFLPGDSILQTGAMEFDASTFEVWGALLNGLKLVLVNKETILIPGKLKAALGVFAVSTIWMTSPLFNQMLQEDSEIFAGLKNLLVGGDVLSPSHINRLMSRYPHLNVINGYGPTENTTFSTICLIQQEYTDNIPIGKPIANSTAYIVDRYNQLQPIGVPGELLVGGDGIARGYLNNPELTGERFINFHHSSFIIHHSKLYKTGDLARWLPDGNIEFLGRIDQQVKIRGFRIELGEIENQLLKHKYIKEAVVLINEDTIKDKSLTAYIISTEELLDSELREYLQEKLPEYMIPSNFVRLEKIPLTSNGKLDRKALPKPELKIGESYIAPRNEIEKKLIEIWSEVLGRDELHAMQLKTSIGIDDNFFQLGGHSLKATVLVSKIHKVFDVNVPLTEIFKTPTIRNLSIYIKASVKGKYLSIEPIEKKEYYALSSAQKRQYILYKMKQAGIEYNIPFFSILEGEINKNKIERTFIQLIDRHESMRTSFFLFQKQPVQRIHVLGDIEFKIEYYEELKTLSDFVRPFDLMYAPLIRVGLVRVEKEKHIFMVDMHHIISDGTSMGILITEFMHYYAGNELAPLRIQYKEYAEWQFDEKENKSILKQEEYWLGEFNNKIPQLRLPLDYKRPTVQSFAGKTISFEIGIEDTASLNHLAVSESMTLYMILLSLYFVFLSKLSGQEDIVVGTPTAGRQYTDLENIVGMFVNTLALRNFPKGELTFIEFLRDVKKRTLGAFENQGYPFEVLIEKVQVKRDTGRNPLFDTMFALQNIEISQLEIPGLKLSHYDFETRISKFDLILAGFENEKKLTFSFQYCYALFKEETIKKFIGYFLKVISIILENPDIMISRIEILTEEEKERIRLNTGEEYVNNWEDSPQKPFVGPSTHTEKKISILWSKVLGIENIDVTLGFFQLGGNSIKALLLVSEINEAFNATLNITDIFEYLTIRDLSEYIKGAVKKEFLVIEPTEKKEYYALSSAQKRQYILYQMDQKGVGYNIPFFSILEGNIDKDRLEHTFIQLIDRHESMRTSFFLFQKQPVQRIHIPDDIGFKIEYYEELKALSDFVRPFDLMSAPLIRVGLVRVEKEKHIFMVDMHHIISDGTSIGILIKEFMHYYSGNELAPLRIQYKEYVEWQLSEKDNKSILKQEEYWLGEFNNKIPQLYLPLDYKRPAVQSFAGKTINFEIGIEDTASLNHLAVSESMTLYMVLLSLYFVFLSKLSGQEDIVVGTPTAGRQYTYLENIVGMFVNTLALRDFPKGELTFREFLRDVKKRTLGAFENQGYPFEVLIEKVQVKRDTGRNPLFDTMFALQNIEISQFEIPGIKLSPYDFETKISKFDLILAGFESEKKLTFSFQYCTALFKEDTIKKFIGYFLKVILIILENPEIMVSQIEVLTDEDKERIRLNKDEEYMNAWEDSPKEIFVGPRTDTEKKISILWSKVLGIENIDVTLDFFQLGGNSIKALLLVSEINETFNATLNIMDIFDHLTVEKLAILLNERRQLSKQEPLSLSSTETGIEQNVFTTKDDNIVLLKKVSIKENHLFFIHDGTGEVGGYIKFCNLLQTGFNCWGIQSNRIKNCAPANFFIADLAGQYIEKIKMIQSTGPYNIVGWSIGGSIALEIAMQFEKQNEKVTFLGLIDSLPPSKPESLLTQEFSKKDELNLLKMTFANNTELLEKIKNQEEIENLWVQVTNYLEASGFDVDSFRKIIKENYGAILPANLRLNNIREAICHFNWIRTLINAAQRYIPGNKIKAPVHFFEAMQSSGIKKENWGKYSVHAIQYYQIAGDHRSIFEPPFVEDFAGTFDCVIKKAI